jgi:DNA-binding XRE family transcriptional regulator
MSLKSLRVRAGLSREELAEKAGVHWTTIAGIEGPPQRTPRPGTRLRLARALNVEISDVAEFVRDLDDGPSESPPQFR